MEVFLPLATGKYSIKKKVLIGQDVLLNTEIFQGDSKNVEIIISLGQNIISFSSEEETVKTL